MAIQKINLGTEPLGEGGDTYRSANTKINENFTNEDHAASRLVGKRSSNLVQVSDVAEIARSVAPVSITLPDSETDLSALPTGSVYRLNTTHPSYPSEIPKMTSGMHINTYAMTDSSSQNTQIARPIRSRDFWIRSRVYGGGGNAYSNWAKIYTSGNTTKDSKTNLLLDSENELPENSAASRLVGTARGQVPLSENVNELAYNLPNLTPENTVEALENNGKGYNAYLDLYGKTSVPTPKSDSSNNRIWQVRYDRYNDSYATQFAINYRLEQYWFRTRQQEWKPWREIYHSGNTTKEDGTGYLVASSPVLKMQHDSFEKVHEAEKLEIDTKHIKSGVYEITGTTGLREGDGWNLKPPKDVNGNVLCICEASEKNGVITLKTYKKRFDFETVSIVADYEQPTDIPEGATVMLRFNDLPQEELDEPELVPEEPIVEEEAEPEAVEEESSEEPSEESE